MTECLRCTGRALDILLLPPLHLSPEGCSVLSASRNITRTTANTLGAAARLSVLTRSQSNRPLRGRMSEAPAVHMEMSRLLPLLLDSSL